MPIRKPRFVTNLQSYFHHFGRGILLLIGVLAIIALVVATFIYGDQRREEAEGVNTEEVATTEESAGTNDTGNDGAVTQTPQDGQDESEGQAAGTVDDSEERPAEIANTGPEHVYALAAMLMGWLLYAHRRSARGVRQAQLKQ